MAFQDELKKRMMEQANGQNNTGMPEEQQNMQNWNNAQKNGAFIQGMQGDPQQGILQNQQAAQQMYQHAEVSAERPAPVSSRGASIDGQQPQTGAGEQYGVGPERAGAKKVDMARIAKATEKLVEYISWKSVLDDRLVRNEQWWEGKAFEVMTDRGNMMDTKRPTNWLFNVCMGKHADLMEAYPEPNILPRERNDQEMAKQLTEILPVVLQQNEFHETYSKNAWEKNKNGTGIYGIFWDNKAQNGLGDVVVEKIEMLNLFWQKGVEDIQDSENVFLVKAVDMERLKSEYPELEGQQLSGPYSLRNYKNENRESNATKAMVVDWYYHTYDGGKKVLQYCKFVGNHVLYASEDDEQLQGAGWYDDGDYPFVMDPLFPVKGSCAGRGYIDLGHGTQESIDLLDHAMVMNALAGSVPRWLVTDDSNVNEAEFADFTKHFIHVQGASMNGIQPVQATTLGSTFVTLYNNKVEELKQTTGNQDVSNGVGSGVTAASAIAALQESAGRSSRDSITGTYRAFRKIIGMVIERIRQFYDTPRTFRILGADTQMDFVTFSNESIRPQQQPMIGGMDMGLRLPVFDCEVVAEKANSYTKMSQNELAFQLLNAGVFNLQMVDQSLLLLDNMDFKGKDKLISKLHEGQTMQQQLAMWQQMALEMAQRYEPQTAQKMMMALQAEGGPAAMGTMAQSQAVDPEAIAKESDEKGFMTRAREEARGSAQPY